MSLGCSVSLYPATEAPVRLSKRWDSNIDANRNRLFTDWATDNDIIIWTHCPIAEQIAWAKKQGIRTGIFCLWHEIGPADYRAYQTADFVVAPNAATGAFVSHIMKTNNIRTLPWDTGQPFTIKDPRITSKQTWVLMPMTDYEPYYMEATALEVAGRALHRFPSMHLTVPFNASKMAPFALHRLRQFRRYFGSRIQLLPGVPLKDRHIMFGTHDLTYWPVSRANTGMVGLTSVTMGTPVLAFDIPPCNEFLSDECNATLTPSVIGMGDMGRPRLEPDYAAMETALHSLLESPEILRKQQQNTIIGLSERRSIFEEVLTRMIQ